MLPPRPPSFDIVRAVFYLLTAIIVIGMLAYMTIIAMCEWGIITGKWSLEECRVFDIRGWWQEILTAVLVLLNTRGPPPEKPPEPKDKP